jgi:hypothetical protein
MFGTFQQSNLRIEVDATAATIRESLTNPELMRQWLWPQQFSPDFKAQALWQGQTFSSHLGLITITHHVDKLTSHGIRLVLHGGIDGFHEWCWGDGWVQSRIEGVSALPLNLAQTASLLRLRLFLSQPAQPSAA